VTFSITAKVKCRQL